MTTTVLPKDSKVSRHYGAVIAANSRPGPGRGPAPAPGPERWWWLRWRMYDTLLLDTLDLLDAAATVIVRRRWPEGWPTPESGLLSIRQMEWVRVTLIGGRPLDVAGRLFA